MIELFDHCSYYIILSLGIASVFFLIWSLVPRFTAPTRTRLLIIGNLLCSANFLAQIIHTWTDVITSSLNCIVDTQLAFLICSAVLMAITVIISIFSLNSITRKLR